MKLPKSTSACASTVMATAECRAGESVLYRPDKSGMFFSESHAVPIQESRYLFLGVEWLLRRSIAQDIYDQRILAAIIDLHPHTNAKQVPAPWSGHYELNMFDRPSQRAAAQLRRPPGDM